jgi:hypothetical protein
MHRRHRHLLHLRCRSGWQGSHEAFDVLPIEPNYSGVVQFQGNTWSAGDEGVQAILDLNVLRTPAPCDVVRAVVADRPLRPLARVRGGEEVAARRRRGSCC